jgi:hypothetical protein
MYKTAYWNTKSGHLRQVFPHVHPFAAVTHHSVTTNCIKYYKLAALLNKTLKKRQGKVQTEYCCHILDHGWQSCLTARGHTVYKFQSNSFACPWEFWREIKVLVPSTIIINYCVIINAYYNYRIYSHNLRTFFPGLAAEKSGCVKYADFFLWRSWSGFYSDIIENTVSFVNILL